VAAIDQTQAGKLINASLGTTALTAFVSPPSVKLISTTTPSTSTADGSELTGTGYTVGGTSLSGNLFSAASAGAATGPGTSALSWTNGSGGTWNIYGLEIWDNAGSGLRWWFGPFTGQPITVANGNTFQIAVGAISVGLT
jgi:hypothetical protein